MLENNQSLTSQFLTFPLSLQSKSAEFSSIENLVAIALVIPLVLAESLSLSFAGTTELLRLTGSTLNVDGTGLTLHLVEFLIESELITFLRRVTVDAGDVDKEVLTTVVAADKAEALGVVEEFAGTTGSHCEYSFEM